MDETGGVVTEIVRNDSALYVRKLSQLEIEIVSDDSIVAPTTAVVTLDGTGLKEQPSTNGVATFRDIMPGRYVARVAFPAFPGVPSPSVQRNVDVLAGSMHSSIRMPRILDFVKVGCASADQSAGHSAIFGRVADSSGLRASAQLTLRWQDRPQKFTNRNHDGVLNWVERSFVTNTTSTGLFLFCGVPNRIVSITAVGAAGRATYKLSLDEKKTSFTVPIVLGSAPPPKPE